jgi:hypothetical protein
LFVGVYGFLRSINIITAAHKKLVEENSPRSKRQIEKRQNYLQPHSCDVAFGNFLYCLSE